MLADIKGEVPPEEGNFYKGTSLYLPLGRRTLCRQKMETAVLLRSQKGLEEARITKTIRLD